MSSAPARSTDGRPAAVGTLWPLKVRVFSGRHDHLTRPPSRRGHQRTACERHWVVAGDFDRPLSGTACPACVERAHEDDHPECAALLRARRRELQRCADGQEPLFDLPPAWCPADALTGSRRSR
ncbi:hypothetical protein [Kitasatospora sp. NPDC088783]|uniref:hypothetical protein n=1 Tax=Kitasatospora sp. NPDC088783 TaxID=3364077 RepID=UPI0037F12B85